MTGARASLFVMGVLAFAPSCSSDDNGVDCAKMCDHLVGCGAAAETKACVARCRGEALSSACRNAVEAASCEEASLPLDEGPAWADVCYPPCSDTESECVGDGVRLCNDGRALTPTCDYLCKTQNLVWTGSCGESYGESTCFTGECCWCAPPDPN